MLQEEVNELRGVLSTIKSGCNRPMFNMKIKNIPCKLSACRRIRANLLDSIWRIQVVVDWGTIPQSGSNMRAISAIFFTKE